MTSDAGFLAYRELDDAIGLSAMAGERLADARPGKNGRLCELTYQAGSCTKPGRVVAKVEWHPGKLDPHVGFIVTNMARPAENVVGFYNRRGACEQWIREDKGAIRWTRFSCRSPPTPCAFSFMRAPRKS